LGVIGATRDEVIDEALHGNVETPVLDQVMFRCDFPAWRRTRCERDRRLLDDLMLGERTQDVARKFGLTPGRISQLRREFHADWQRFCGELAEPEAGSRPEAVMGGHQHAPPGR
jgi:hypothetical protein